MMCDMASWCLRQMGGEQRPHRLGFPTCHRSYDFQTLEIIQGHPWDPNECMQYLRVQGLHLHTPATALAGGALRGPEELLDTSGPVCLTFQGQLAAEPERGGEGRTEVPATAPASPQPGCSQRLGTCWCQGPWIAEQGPPTRGLGWFSPGLTILFLRRTPSCLPFVTTDVNSRGKGAPGASIKTPSFAPQGEGQRAEAGAQQSRGCNPSVGRTTSPGTHGKWRLAANPVAASGLMRLEPSCPSEVVLSAVSSSAIFLRQRPAGYAVGVLPPALFCSQGMHPLGDVQ